MRGFVRGFFCLFVCLFVCFELLPTQSNSNYYPRSLTRILPSIIKCQTVAVAGVLDVAGTYGSAVLLFKLLVG